MPSSDAPDAETIDLYVTPGHVFDQTLNLRVTPAYKEEIEILLDEHGVSHGQILEFSDTVQHIIIAATALGSAGTLAAIASVIRTFAQRHNGKKIVLEPGKIEIVGYSPGGAEKAINHALDKQAAVNDQYAAMLNRNAPELPAPLALPSSDECNQQADEIEEG